MFTQPPILRIFMVFTILELAPLKAEPFGWRLENFIGSSTVASIKKCLVNIL